MGKRVMSITLSTKDLDRAIKEIENYKTEIRRKMDMFSYRVCSEIASISQAKFSASTINDSTSETRPAEVSVSVQAEGPIKLVIAQGEDAVWVEFGSGVTYNTSVGTSPNPWGAGLGFTIGSYGKGKGANKAWGYYDGSGAVKITHGTPASMPLFSSTMEVLSRIGGIAREVFT